MNILIQNIDIVSPHLLDPSVGYHIAIADGHIAKITQDLKELQDFTPHRIIDGQKKIAIPGLVNAHTHTPMTILRNMADDLALHDWLFNHIFPTEAKLTSEDIYWGSLLGIAEMIRSGTTAFADMYYFVDETAKAVATSGIRANLSLSAYSFKMENGEPCFQDNTKAFESFYQTWNGGADNRIGVSVLVHSPYIYHMQSMKDSADIAKQFGTGVHIHILETLKEREDTIKRYQKDGAMACLEAGIFDVPCMAAHCVHVSDENLDVFAQKKVSVLHNPTSNLKLGSGIARIPDMLKKGINVALGTDGTASNNNLDMFEEMHLAALIHKGVTQDPVVVNAREVLKMATQNGAMALGLEGKTGLLKEGYLADITIIDRDKIHYTPYKNPLSALSYSTQSLDVDTVIVQGKVLLHAGNFESIDVERARFEVEKIAKRIFGGS